MTTPTEEILERLGACEAVLEAHRGYLKAMEYAIRVSVLTHPESERLAAAWTTLLPGITAAHQHDGGPLFSAAFQQSLVVLTEQIAGG